MNITRLKSELLCRGAHIQERMDKGRRAGAGPTGGRYFTLPNGTCVEIPLQGKFVENSPFHLVQNDGNWLILRDMQPLVRLTPIPTPRFYDKTTSDGMPMRKIAILHGKDCLASTVYSKCIYWKSEKQCKFCGIELGPRDRLLQKKPHQLAEVAEEAFKEGIAQHVTLTTGTPLGSDKGALLLAETTQVIKELVDLPVHVQLEPPNGTRFLEVLYSAGVDTVGLHVESFDPQVLQLVCPAKPKVEDFLKAWENAVELFGEGQVSTFVIAGLGETDESIMQGVETAARIGVIPYLLPLRPIAGTCFEKTTPPTPERMIRLYRNTVKILRSVGLDPRKSKAGCVRCSACSALQESFVFPP